MKGIQKRLGSLLMAAVMLLSLAVTPAMAAGEKEPPTEVKSLTAGEIYNTILSVQFENTDWLNAITAVAVNDDTYQSSGSVNSFTDAGNWGMGTAYGAYGSYTALQIVMKSGTTYPATIKFSATGYKDLTVKVEKSGSDYTATVIADSGSSGSEPEPPTPPEKKTIDLSKVSFAKSSDGNDWQVTFGEDGYAEKITAVTVNGKPWNATSFLADGGKYKISDGKLLFARNSYGGTAALKSGDVITITADGYEALTFKLVINTDGSASVEKNDGKGDPLELHVKLVGSFEAAIVGQKNYDGVSSASVGGASSNKNSAVTVYGALVKKGNDPTDKDWEELNHQSEIQLVGSKCSVSIVPDTEKGTPAAADSGMEGVYMTISSDLTLNGTPKDAGSYLISVHIEDNQGRTATSNALPFRIYTGEETLADQIKTENLNQYSNGLYAWDIMEPWAIKNFGSNVTGEENSVRVPKDLEVWYGSHQSGTYGVLGNDIAWDDVKAGNIPQTLYIPNGCNLTLMNMKVLSSVRIVVEKGGKLTLRDSSVQGIIDVQSGGTFSMNYDSYEGKFETGASLCGQLRMESGSTLENAAIYSHTNYLANGDLTDRSNDEAVVLTTGDVTVKGQVFIRGDDAGGTEKGQTALKVQNGTLTLEDGAVLAAYGGDGKTLLYPNGGSAIELDNGTISGNGKVIALGGSVLFGSGSSAVSSSGTITTTEAYIQGATAYNRAGKNAQPGKSHDASVAINSGKKYVETGHW